MDQRARHSRRGSWTLALLFAFALPCTELRSAEAPASPAAITAAIQGLVNLKDGDEKGFAAQAKVLLSGGEKALDAVEAELKKQSGEKAFRLKRVRDMFCWPLDVKGVITMAVSDKEIANRFDVGSQVIVTAVNGTPTPDYETFSATVNRVQKTGKATIPMDLIKEGRKRTVGIPNGKFGYYMGDYPYVLTHYIHKGDRASAWDDDVKAGLQSFGLDWWHEAGIRLKKAMDSGCRDPKLLSCSMHALIQANRPAEALAVYNNCKPTIKEKMGDGGDAAYYEMHKGLALLYTGDAEGAIKQLTPLLNNTKGPVGYVRGYLGLAVQEKDPARAIALFKEAAAKGPSYLWDSARHELLKKQGRYDEAADLVTAYGSANGKVLAGWLRTEKGAAKVPEPAHWAVVYRNDFVVPAAVFRMFEYHSDTLHRFDVLAEDGALVTRSKYYSGAVLWNYYRNARVDVDVHMTDFEKYIDHYHRHNTRTGIQYPETTVSGLFTYQGQREGKGSEIGFGYNAFRRLVQIILFNKPFYQSYLPTIDPGAPHHLTVEWIDGRARFFIDGKKISEQFYPRGWFGKIGLSANQGQVRFDNMEIRVPSDTPVDNEAVLAGYKMAADAMARNDLSAALSALEAVADLQPRNQDFYRLYAAYIEAKAKRTEWNKIIGERMAGAASQNVLLLLIAAESHLGLYTLSESEYDAARSVYNDTSENVEYTAKHLKAVKAARDVGSLEIYAIAVTRDLRKGKATFADVEAAMKLAVTRCPDTPGPLYRLGGFYLSQGRMDLAIPVLQDLQKQLPKATFLSDILDRAKAGQQPVKPPVPASEDF